MGGDILVSLSWHVIQPIQGCKFPTRLSVSGVWEPVAKKPLLSFEMWHLWFPGLQMDSTSLTGLTETNAAWSAVNAMGGPVPLPYSFFRFFSLALHLLTLALASGLFMSLFCLMSRMDAQSLTCGVHFPVENYQLWSSDRDPCLHTGHQHKAHQASVNCAHISKKKKSGFVLNLTWKKLGLDTQG